MESKPGAPGTLGYAAGCATGGAYETFSAGVFEWLPKAGGKGVKRGLVFARISGPRSCRNAIEAAAKAFCAAMVEPKEESDGRQV